MCIFNTLKQLGSVQLDKIKIGFTCFLGGGYGHNTFVLLMYFHVVLRIQPTCFHVLGKPVPLSHGPAPPCSLDCQRCCQEVVPFTFGPLWSRGSTFQARVGTMPGYPVPARPRVEGWPGCRAQPLSPWRGALSSSLSGTDSA